METGSALLVPREVEPCPRNVARAPVDSGLQSLQSLLPHRPWRVSGRCSPQNRPCCQGRAVLSGPVPALQGARAHWLQPCPGPRERSPAERRLQPAVPPQPRSEARRRARRQLQVPREQAQEVEDDGGFMAPRRVLAPGKEAKRG